MLVQDLRAKARLKYRNDQRSAMMKVLSTDGTLAMILYRLMQGSREAGLGPLEMLFNKLNSTLGSCIIGRGAEFGPGFVLFHSNGVVINGRVRGGRNIHIQHEVTLGDDDHGQTPVLGNDVYLGAGAKIIGGVTIGDGTRVGANAVVVNDVPSGATVVGIPARVVRTRDVASEPALIRS